jgi:hypothetical protein
LIGSDTCVFSENIEITYDKENQTVANYWDSISLVVDTSSDEERTWLLHTVDNNVISADDWALVPEEYRQGRDADEYSTGCRAYPQGSDVWIDSSDRDSANIEDVVAVLIVFQQKFEKTEPIILTFARHCSAPRPYSTGGAAVAIFRGEAWWFFPEEAAAEKIRQLGGRPPDAN